MPRLFQKIGEVSTLLNSLYEASILLMSKLKTLDNMPYPCSQQRYSQQPKVNAEQVSTTDDLINSIMFNSKRLQDLPLRSGTRKGQAIFTTSIQHSTESSSPSNQERERKDFQIGKEEVNLYLFTDDVISYVKYSKDSTKQLLELKSELHRVVGFRVSRQKAVASYTLTVNKKEIKKTTSFITVPKRIKYFEV